ncbi:MAG: carboxylesterase/lipase family protein [Acidobacteria bacterium]|nr:carboxylesterase/lipase family protein [Acidobacteriota bacterium]
MTDIDRRSFLGCGTLAAAGLFTRGAFSPAWAQDVRGLPATPIVQTTAGRLRGVVRFGVNQFWGVRYAASTAGANRFMPPAPVAPWTGVRDAVEVSQRSPQDEGGPISEVWALDRREPMGEDCLGINIFTPGLGSGSRPVMVWLHGGGFSGASGNWLLYDGTNLARKEDVVVVAVTHRLNLFGFLHLADLGGEQWANSSNVGMQDIVAALGWIKDNIAAFGGNPGNVTVFGQSGGGGKVCTLMAMPSARGLFHRAIAMSGSAMRGATRENATGAAEQFLAKLGLTRGQLDRLQQMPWPQLNEAFYREPRVQGLGGGPVVDGRSLPRDQWSPDAPEASADVPFMMGSTETEDGWNDPPPPLEMPEAEMMTRVTRIARGDEAAARSLVALYRKTHPGITNTDVWLVMNSDNARRANAQTLAELKTVQGRAPAYLYFFNWRSPVHDGRMKAYHTLDIPFAFYNVDIAASMTGSGQDRYALAHRMSATYAAFARTGNPNNPEVPNWPAFSARNYPTMILGNDVKVVDDPNREERLALKALREGSRTTSSGE